MYVHLFHHHFLRDSFCSIVLLLLLCQRLLNYIYNTNRYSENARVVLNAVFSKEKLIGFPLYYDYDYMYLAIPSNNILVNQFMYGGIFGFFFYLLIVGLFGYLFIHLKKLPIVDKNFKYYPILFVVSYVVITLVMDQNSYDLFNYSLIVPSYMSPFFYVSLFIFGYYFALTSEEEKVHEE